MAHEGFRLSPQQRRVWSLLQLDGGAPYHVCGVIAIDGELDIGRLDAALRQLVERHEILRTRIRRLPGADAPVQLIGAGAAPARAEYDLRGQPAAQQARMVAALLGELGAASFDVERGPTLRAALATLSSRQHMLLLALPALLADGPSLAILTRDLGRAYTATASAAPPDEPPQYADLAEFLNELLESGETEAGRGHWHQQDLAALGALRLPLEQAGAPRAHFRPAVCAAALSAALATQIAARAHETSTAAWLLASWQTLLWRLSDEPDVLVGVLHDGRAYAELAAALGPLARYAPLRCRLEARAPFDALVRQSHAALAEAAKWQEYFSWEQLGADQLAALPFMPFCFDYVAAPPAVVADDVTFVLRRSYAYIDRCKARLVCVAGAGELALELHYDAELFADAVAERMLAMLLALVADSVARPQSPLDELEILDEAQRRRLLELAVASVATLADEPSDACFHRLFEQQVARTPDAVAVVFDFRDKETSRQADKQTTGRTTNDDSAFSVQRSAFSVFQMTYRELNARANRLARYLRGLGVGPETLVAISMERSPELIVGVLGILKAGGAYVPLDLAYPIKRLAFMLEDSQARMLLTDSIYDLRLTIDDLGETDTPIVNRKSKIVNLATNWPLIAREPDGDLDGGACADNLAYVIYTSGSTGAPKGVLTRHCSVVHFWAGLRERVYDEQTAAQLRATLNAPLVFDASVKQLVLLLGGHALWIMSEELRRDGPALLAELWRARLEVLDCTPSLLGALIAAGLLENGHAPPLILLGGEPIDDALWQQLRSQHDITFYNHYGPTECTVNATIARLDPALAMPTLGRPIRNTWLYLLDRRMQPTPLGIVGEIYIGGAGLARGYLGRPDLTAERFVPNPFTGDKETRRHGDKELGVLLVSVSPCLADRLYRTGDLARYREDGELVFLGRRDQQIKLRGYRIELGEIMATLAQHPSVYACAVVARADDGRQRLVAYVVPAETLNDERRTMNGPEWPSSAFSVHRSALGAELRSFLAERLPDYMLPAAFVLLDALPLTAGGKLDRRALPAPGLDQAETDDDAALPRTPVERLLARIWAEVLRVERVGRDDNFFALGGDSLLCIQVVVRAGQSGLRITPLQLFERQTIAALATVAEAASTLQTIERPASGPLPLTPIQHWFFEQGLPDPHDWTQTMLLELRQPVEPTRLARALHALLTRYDALRLRFVREGHRWQQLLADAPATAALRWVDLAALPMEQQPAALELAVAGLRAVLRLDQGPLLQVALIGQGADRPVRLLLAAHALAADGFSYRLLAADLQAAYRQLGEGDQVELPPATAFARWAEWLAAYARSDALRQEATYWLAAPPTALVALPLDFPDDAPGMARVVGVALEVEETRALLCAPPTSAARAPIDTLLLATLVRTFAGWVGAGSLLVDMRWHGRTMPLDGLDLSYTVGWLTAIYPIALRLQPSVGPAETLRAVHAQLAQVPSNGLGYGVLRYLSDERALVEQLRSRPQAQVSFNYLGVLDAAGEDALFNAAPAPSGGLWSPRYLIEVQAQVSAARLRVLWKYDERRHERATIIELAERYLAELRALVIDSAQPGGYTPDDFPLANLSQLDLQQVIAKVHKAKK